MSELDAILASNDSDISKTRNLYEIASRKTTFDPKDNLLPTTTLQYLRAFCDIHRPRLTRRWIGLALRTIIDTSPQVCEHLAKFPAELALLGTLVLRGEESEELRIIAGLVIREACAHYVPYQSFWPSEKVFNGAPNFPLEGDHDWLHAFQNFVDTCDELKLISNPTSDPAILYPIALSASDGFRWMNTEQMAPALLIQDDIITVMTLDDSLQSFDFIDILGRNIVATSSRKSALHDSQAREKIKNEPWDLIITLNPDPWTFHINLSEHFGTELIMMFKSKGDMTECQSCFNELVSPSRGPRMLSDQSQAQGKVFASPSLVCGANATPPRTETPCHVEPGNYSPSAHHTSMSQNYNASQISQAELPHSEKNGIKTEKQVAPGALPKIIKTSRRISSARREINGFDIPDDSPVIKRRSRLGAQNQADTRTSTSKANKSQPITCTKGTNSFEDDDDGDSLIPFAERTIIDPVMPMKSISKLFKSSKEYGIPAGEKNAKPGGKLEEDLDIYDFLPDELQQGQRSVNTKSDPIDVDGLSDSDSETSGDDSDQSEYIQTKFKTPSTNKRTSVPRRAHSNKNVRSTRGSRVTSRTKATNCKANTQQVAPAKYPVISKLVSKTQPVLGQEQKRNSSLEKVFPVKISKPVPNLPKEPQGALHVRHESNEAKTSGHAMSTAKASNGAVVGANETSKVKVNAVGTSHLNLESPYPASMSISSPQKKRVLDLSAPSTPRPKRARRDELNDHSGYSGNSLENNAMTFAPLRLMADPSSPCADTKRARHGRRQNLTDAMPPPTFEDVERFPFTKSPLGHDGRTDSQNQVIEEHRTPLHRIRRREPMSGADSIEILSSNSKPLPGEPDEDSRAISGHADRNEIRHQKELGDFEVTRKDPFRQSSRNQVQAKFTRRLTETLVGDDLTVPVQGLVSHTSEVHGSKKYASTGLAAPLKLSPLGRVHLKSPSPTRTEIFAVKSKFQLVQVSKRISQAGHAEKVPYESTRPVPQQTVLVGEASQPSRQPEDKEHGDDLEGGTLVDHEDDLPIRPSPAPLSSSPPAPLGSADSSHSSTSAEPEEPRSPSVSYQDQDEMEWEATLEPHQRSVGEQLVRVSRRLMRHIVDAETAVDDMAKTYHEDGEHLIANLVNKNREHFDQTLRSIQEKKTSMRAEFEKIAKELSEEKKRFKDASSSRNGGEAQPIQLQNRPPPTSPLASRSDVER